MPRIPRIQQVYLTIAWLMFAWLELISDVVWFWKNVSVEHALGQPSMQRIGVGLTKRIVEKISKPNRKVLLQRQLSKTKNLKEYEDIAYQLDVLLGNDLWRQNPRSKSYDYRLISSRSVQLAVARNEGDIYTLMDLLRSGLLRNLGSLGSIALYNRTYLGTKLLIEDYIREVIQCLEFIDQFPLEKSQLTDQRRLDFFHDTRQSFGRSALVLHGGTMFGLCHIGTVKALHSNGLLPHIISGATVGAIVAALVCSCPEKDLSLVLENISKEMPPFTKEFANYKKESVVEGVLTSMYPPEILLFEKYVRSILGDITFEEAYIRSERALNITITPVRGDNNTSGSNVKQVPKLMNYLTTPNIVIWTAIRASIGSGIFPEEVELLAKTPRGLVPYHHTKIEFVPSNTTVYFTARESPYTRLSELFNVNNFIVSLARPYFAPVLMSEFKHRGYRSWKVRLVRLFRMELQYRLMQFAHLGLLPGLVKRWVLDENIPGGFQVTIVPELPNLVKDFARVLDSHGIKEKVDYWILIGERSVWPMMSIIWARCAVEFVLDGIYNKRAESLTNE